MMKFLIIYIAVVFVMSVCAFFAYGEDKRRARKRQWRIKESTLLGFGVFGGAVGALLGMNVFRHKTKHWYFWTVNIVAFILHIVAAVAVCVLVF